MGLSEMIKEIVIEMENEEFDKEEHYSGKMVIQLFRGYVRALQLALKASANQQVEEMSKKKQAQEEMARQIKEEEERLAALSVDVRRAEHGVHMAELIGEGMDGDLVEIDPNMPLRAKTLIAGKVFVLVAPGKLEYSSEETAKLIPKKSEIILG